MLTIGSVFLCCLSMKMKAIKRREFILLLLGVIVVVSLAWMVSGRWQRPSVPEDGSAVKIGAVLPLTGSASNYGESIRKGLDLAIEDINEAGGINGQQVQIIYGDDRTETTDTVSEAIKLLEVDQVDVLVGGIWDFLAEATLPVIKDRNALLLIPSDVAEVVIDKQSDYPTAFVLHSPLAAHQVSVEKFLQRSTGSRVATMAPNSTWGHIMTNMFKDAADNTGYQVVEEILLAGFDDNDIASEITLIKESSPDAILLAINPNDAARFIRKYHELGLNAPVLASWEMAISYLDGNIPA